MKKTKTGKLNGTIKNATVILSLLMLLSSCSIRKNDGTSKAADNYNTTVQTDRITSNYETTCETIDDAKTSDTAIDTSDTAIDTSDDVETAEPDENVSAETNDFNSIAGRFTDILVTDDISAIRAAQEAATLLELENAADELTVAKTSVVEDLTYYRLQQNYKGMSVYGRTMVIIVDNFGTTQGFLTNAVDISDEMDTGLELSNTDIKKALSNWSNADISVIELLKCEKTIFGPADTTTPELCYYVTAKISGEIEIFCSVVISVNDKKVIYNDVALNPAEICVSSTGAEFSGSKNASDEYVLFDMERNFYCLDANDYNTYSFKKMDWNENSATAIKSNTFTFDSAYDYVFEAVNSVEKISDFYKSTFYDNGTEHFVLMANCGHGTSGGLMPIIVSKELQSIDGITDEVGVINLGSANKESVASNVVTLAHEYTHVISNNNVHWVAGLDFKNQAQAINEAYSDLFSLIIKEKINPDGYIWDDGGRIDDIAKITKTSYPTKIDFYETTLISASVEGANDEEKEDFDVMWTVDSKGRKIGAYTYTNAVVLEYAAYLMTASGSTECNLTIDELGDLWYHK